MNQLRTRGIVLKRTDYGEADRIVTMLTPEYGKLRLMARGVRKPRAKLAGGIELFSISDITFIRGRGEIGTLISARLGMHYGRIVADIERVQLGYDLLKLLDRATEDEPEPAYFSLLNQALAALNDPSVDRRLIRAWFGARLLRLAGHAPNLRTDAEGRPLAPAKGYTFDFDAMAFTPVDTGRFGAADIKFLRLLFGDTGVQAISRVTDLATLLDTVAPLVTAMERDHLHGASAA